MRALINSAILSFTIRVILSRMVTTSIATETLFRWISLNSLMPLVNIEKSRKAVAFIKTAIIKPMARYSPEYEMMVVLSTVSV